MTDLQRYPFVCQWCEDEEETPPMPSLAEARKYMEERNGWEWDGDERWFCAACCEE